MANVNDIANALEKLGATVDRANFATNMQKPEFAERVRVSLEGAGASVPDSATFYDRYGVNKVAQAKAQYAQDVAAQRQTNIQDAKRDNPNLAAFLPRTLENVVAGDRGKWGNVLDFAKDVTSLPGRMADATIGNLSENVANLIYGPKDIRSQWELAKESQKANLARMAQVELPPEASGVEKFAHGVVTDPYAIPLIAVGGPLASAIGKTGLTGAKLVGAGIAADAALNAATGVVDRSASADPNVKALSASDIARDAALGGAFSGIVRGLGASGSWLKRKSIADLGEEVIASTPRKSRGDVIEAFDPSGDKDKAATAIGEYLTTTPEGKYIPVRKTPFTQSAPEAIVENVATKQKTATTQLDDQYRKLDTEFERAVLEDQRIRETAGVDKYGNIVNAEGNPVGTGYLGANPENVRNYGVPLVDILDNVMLNMKLADKKAYDMRAITAARNEILQRFSPHNMYEGVIAPSTARDLKKRIYSEITDNPKKADLDDFYTDAYRAINEHIANLEHGITETMYRNKATGDVVRESSIKSLSDMHKYEPVEGFQIAEENLVSEGNKAVRQALSLGEGIDRSRFFNPQGRQTQLGDAADVAKLALASSNPVAFAATIGRSPSAKRLAGQELGVLANPLAEGVARVTSRHASNASQARQQRQESEKLNANARSLTETEYRNVQNIIATKPSNRTQQQVQYLQQFLR